MQCCLARADAYRKAVGGFSVAGDDLCLAGLILTESPTRAASQGPAAGHGSYETTGERGAGRRLRSTVTEHEGSRSTITAHEGSRSTITAHEGSRSTLTVAAYGDDYGDGIGGMGGIARRRTAASTGTIGDYPSGVVFPGPNRGSRVASRGSSGTPRDGGIARRGPAFAKPTARQAAAPTGRMPA